VVLVIITGPDGSGKTTLVDEICKQFNFRVFERGVKDRDKLWEVTRQDTHDALALAVKASEPPVVCDRLFYDDFIYAPITGRDISFLPEEADFVQAIIEVLECPLIICFPPLSVVEENVAKAHQMEGVNENIAKIWKAYKNLFSYGVEGKFAAMGQTGALWYDYTSTFPHVDKQTPFTADLGVVFMHIEEYLEKRKEREAWAPRTRTSR
jgi:hypothetical protein